MQLVFSENELKRAVEVYINGLYARPVKIVAFDLAGTRSKEGLTVTVDILIEGESEPQQLVMPVITASEEQEAPKHDDSVDALGQADLDLDMSTECASKDPTTVTLNAAQEKQYALILEKLNNPDAIKEEVHAALDNADEVVQNKVKNTLFYEAWLKSTESNIADTLAEDQAAMDKIIEENRLEETPQAEPSEPEKPQSTTEAIEFEDTGEPVSETEPEAVEPVPVTEGKRIASSNPLFASSPKKKA